MIGTPLQVRQRRVTDALLDARAELSDDEYRALLAVLSEWMEREFGRLVLGEALRTARGGEA